MFEQLTARDEKRTRRTRKMAVRAMARTEAKAERVLGFLLLALVLTMSLLLVQPAQARAEEPGISTTQTADPNPAIVGEPYTFIVSITNNSVPQRVGPKDFLPTGMELVSARPSQGTCGTSHYDDDTVECTLGEVPSGGSVMVEVIATPVVAGTMTNTAVGLAEFTPATPANTDATTITVNPASK